MKCGLKNRYELIDRYLAGELSDNKAKEFEEHYFQCDICFNELKAAEEAINLIEHEGGSILALKESLRDSAKKNFIQKIFEIKISNRWGIAVSFALFVLVMLFVTLPTNKNSQQHQQNIVSVYKDSLGQEDVNEKIDSSKESSKKIPGKEIAANFSGPNFKSNPYLEEWLSENIRSDNEILDKVISPLKEQKFYNKEITFNWRMIKNEPVTFTILTNQEKKVVNNSLSLKEFPSVKIKISPEVFKHSGLYYWRIEDENEVLYIGKFYFLK